MKHGYRGGGDPRRRAVEHSEVPLDLQEKEAEVLHDPGGEAHDEEGRGDDHPAVPPVWRSTLTGLHGATDGAVAQVSDGGSSVYLYVARAHWQIM